MPIAPRNLVYVLFLGVVLSPAILRAQPAGRLAIGASVMTGSDRRDTRYPPGIVGKGGDVAFNATSRLAFGLEFDVPRARSYELTGNIRHTDGTNATYFRRWTFRGTIVSGFVQWRVATVGPVELSFLTGFGIESRRFGDFLAEDTLDADGRVTRHDVIATPYDGKVYRWTQTPLGFDAAIRLIRHVSLVPQVRYYFNPLAFMNDGCCDGGQMRVRVSLRWVL